VHAGVKCSFSSIVHSGVVKFSSILHSALMRFSRCGVLRGAVDQIQLQTEGEKKERKGKEITHKKN